MLVLGLVLRSIRGLLNHIIKIEFYKISTIFLIRYKKVRKSVIFLPFSSFFMRLFKDWCADAAIGGLDVEQGADGGGDIGHVGEATGLARGDVPAHEDQGNVGVALAPRAVIGAIPLGFTCIDSRAGYDIDLTAALGEVPQLDALLEQGGDGVGVDARHVDGPLDLLGHL